MTDFACLVAGAFNPRPPGLPADVRGRDLHTRRYLTSLQVCRTAEPSPSRLSQSILPADSAVCSSHHRKTPTTRTSSLLKGLGILEQLPPAYGACIHLLSPLLA
jgi:hypothetical protein